MNTNDFAIAAQVAQAHGWNLSGAQITLIIGAGGAILRWLQHEIRAAIEIWSNIGGWTGIKNWFVRGKGEIPIEVKIANASAQLNKPMPPPVVARQDIAPS